MLNSFFCGQAGIIMLFMSRLVSLARGRNKVPRSRRILLRLVTQLFASWGQLAAQGTASQAAISETVRAHFSAAQEAQQRGDYAAAEREYRAILAEAPNFAEVHMNLGLLYQLQDRTPEAMAQFQRGLKVKPTLAGVVDQFLQTGPLPWRAQTFSLASTTARTAMAQKLSPI